MKRTIRRVALQSVGLTATMAVAATAALTVAQAQSTQGEPTANQVDLPGLPHFQCYSVSGEAVRQPENDDRFVRDQFGGKVVDVDEPRRLCAPAQKSEDTAAPGDPPEGFLEGLHLVCHDIDEGLEPREVVGIFSQFTDPTVDFEELIVRRAEELCAPTFAPPGGFGGP